MLRRALRQSGDGYVNCMSQLHAFSRLLARSSSSAVAQVVESSEAELDKFVPPRKPRSLSIDPSSNLRISDPEPEGLRGTALKLLGFYSRQSRLIRGSKTLYSRVSSHVERPELYAILARLRAEGKDGATVGQTVYEIFNHDLEQRIVAQGVKVLISKWMKQLEKNFYGAVTAYDTAMQPEAPQDELARALWRNVFAEDDAIMPSGNLSVPVQALARYVRKEIACLSLTDSESLLSGNIMFSQD